MQNLKCKGFLSLGLLSSCWLWIVAGQTRAGTWNLTDSDFHSRTISVDSINAAGIHSGADVIGWDDVLGISQTVNSQAADAAKFSLIFRGGDKLIGTPVSFNGDTLQWNSSQLGPISFSTDSLTGILENGFAGDDLDQPRTDDVVHLANGDTMHGIINAIAPQGVTIQVGDATPTLGWDSISAVLFSTAGANPSRAPRRMFRIRLADNETVDAADVSLAASQLTITLSDKSIKHLDVALVAGIEQLNGPIAWLTSLTPSENIYKPFFSENFPTRFDRTVADGKPITEKYPGFHHGIGCHSYSKLTYKLDGGWTGFRSQYAIDSDSPLADVTVRVYLDGKSVFEQKNVKAGRIYPPLMIPLQGAKTISLEVDYGENFATEDRFVWLDPALVRRFPEPTTEP
jgi:hypothetical protein